MAGKNNFIFSIQLLVMLLVCSDCHSQTGTNIPIVHEDRQPAFAGKFYPGDKEPLNDTLNAMFGRAVAKQTDKPVLAIVTPHAGYIFSGDVAASAHNQYDKKIYKNIFVIGSSHRTLFDGASIYYYGDFVTPLGTVKVDIEMCKKLMSKNSCFKEYPKAHEEEHTIEVQLPFLQHILGNELNLVPIVLGTQNPKTCKIIAKALKPYFNEDNLFVFSTDLSHYPKYSDAQLSDKRIVGSVLTNSPDTFLKTIESIEALNIPNLQTTMCGWTSVLTLLNITCDIPGITYKLIEIKNSGDSPFGEKKEVVGYSAVAVECDKPIEKTATKDFLTPVEKQNLLQIARQTITDYITKGEVPEVDKKIISEGMLQPSGAFVTLMKNGQLRGCIGNFSSQNPLYKTVQVMAIAASTNDYRFNKVTADEIPTIDIEISVLTPMKKIKSINEIVLRRDGIYMRKGNSSGTFLPQVASETGWSLDEFLGHCANDKADIGWDGWKDAELFTYQAIVFGEKKHTK